MSAAVRVDTKALADHRFYMAGRALGIGRDAVLGKMVRVWGGVHGSVYIRAIARGYRCGCYLGWSHGSRGMFCKGKMVGRRGMDG